MTNSNEQTSAWRAYQQAPWGRIFYSVACANIQHHLPKAQSPLHILDIGGGNGLDAITYAKQGHRVTLLDSSPDMIAEAREAADAENLTAFISCCHADLIEVPIHFPEPVFDVVVCHNVIQYVEDPFSALQAITTALKPHGMLSLIGANQYSEAYREVLQNLNPQAAREKLQISVIQSQTFQQPMHLYTAQEMIDVLHHLQFTNIQQYGIRCVFDYIPDNDLKAEPRMFAQLEALEQILSGTYPYYLLARYFHLIAYKDEHL